MDLQSLKNSPGARHRRKRLGRGMASGLGKTSGKGHKGQMARKGNKHKLHTTYMGVNLCSLDRFEDGTEVTGDLLRQSGMANGQYDGIKILGRGEISKKLTVKVQAFSASAREKIEAAGGTCEVV